jgi:hypothetical protein
MYLFNRILSEPSDDSFISSFSCEKSFTDLPKSLSWRFSNDLPPRLSFEKNPLLPACPAGRSPDPSGRSNDFSPLGGFDSSRSSRERGDGLSLLDENPALSDGRENLEERPGFESFRPSRERKENFSSCENPESFDLPSDPPLRPVGLPPRMDFEKSLGPSPLSLEIFDGRLGFESSRSSRERENGFSPLEENPDGLSDDRPNDLPPRGFEKSFESPPPSPENLEGRVGFESSRERENVFFPEEESERLSRGEFERAPLLPAGLFLPPAPEPKESRLRIGLF